MAAILTEPGSLNPAERLSAQGLIVVAASEIYFPSNARRSVRHAQSGAGIAIEIEIQKIGRDPRIREKIFLIVFGFRHRKVPPLQLEWLTRLGGC
jgi:hypothetical protein